MNTDIRADMAPLVPELLVTDFQRSYAFYTDVVGFSMLYGRPEDNFAYLNLDGAQIMLEQREPGTERDWVAGPMEIPFGRGMNIQIAVADAASVHARCVAANADIFWPIEDQWYRRDDMLLGVRQFIVKDPDGYLLRMAQDIGVRTLEAT
ncbi:MAG: bleomycin resistance protein [Rhizobiaceae bacterium]